MGKERTVVEVKAECGRGQVSGYRRGRALTPQLWKSLTQRLGKGIEPDPERLHLHFKNGSPGGGSC